MEEIFLLYDDGQIDGALTACRAELSVKQLFTVVVFFSFLHDVVSQPPKKDTRRKVRRRVSHFLSRKKKQKKRETRRKLRTTGKIEDRIIGVPSKFDESRLFRFRLNYYFDEIELQNDSISSQV